MERLHKGEAVQKAQQKKVPYSDEEKALVDQYFANAILAESTPSLGECDEFLHGSGMNRDKKSVQDRVKNIIKKKKKERDPEHD